MDEADEFQARTVAVLSRWCAQNGWPGEAGALRGMAGRLGKLVRERGLPPRLAPGDRGEPRDWPAAEVAPLVARVLGPDLIADPLLPTAARQLVKACFQPEFKTCRDSYGERDPAGTCRRQQPDRVRERVSGSHCVDCPYWTSLTPAQHERLLRRAWVTDPAEFDAGRALFLPEDFRALRIFLRSRAPEPAADD